MVATGVTVPATTTFAPPRAMLAPVASMDTFVPERVMDTNERGETAVSPAVPRNTVTPTAAGDVESRHHAVELSTDVTATTPVAVRSS